ncbi:MULTISPECIES: hypothetical protein [Clostridium]|uniref:Lipoprotein n=2 Tax=Clostridium TaxID=1485 RepID=D8GNY9_CLOLD|nr:MULTISPECIES: hypothetical protein [Clostridium]ADK13835.1 hypothetical protein CLJU_c07670 [Clostridium ljungdahlii DSM 13528]AGY77067.1 hypothetical protein CAETHG_2860 [Clostridium autoethanogenum DSM 10061]ALU37208.1 Hypothetical protein CLAU_2781 [Clostridium autoethanogenum DSM 10061]OAA87324.1 hypothetical protein WX45_03444 [Clostridium ljungdahlii DSM 13528]OVY50224.1 hypothetical protein WX72_02984 [Clostridium autoethanogenum]
MKHKVITITLVLIIVGSIALVLGCENQSKTSTNSTSSNSNMKASTNKDTDKSAAKQEIKQRQVQGKVTDLGAGTFTVGKDIEEGLYDVTPADGQGNFIIQNTQQPDLTVNEILGNVGDMGISKARVKLVKDEQIQLEGINKTHFEPVTAPFITEHKATSLYSGRWSVGEDIGSGRYVVTPVVGEGNFIVYSKNEMPKVNEILGNSGVKQVTVNLDDGDIITIMSLNQVDFAPQK